MAPDAASDEPDSSETLTPEEQETVDLIRRSGAGSGEITGTIPGVTGYTTAELRAMWEVMCRNPVRPASTQEEMRLACMAAGLANQLAPLPEALRARAAAIARVEAYAAQHADWCCAKGCTAPEDRCDESCNCESGAILAALRGVDPAPGTGHREVPQSLDQEGPSPC